MSGFNEQMVGAEEQVQARQCSDCVPFRTDKRLSWHYYLKTMKRSKLAEVQIAFILRQSREDTAIGEILRNAGVDDSMLMPSEMSRLHQLVEENGKLKKIIADLFQYKEILQGSRRKL